MDRIDNLWTCRLLWLMRLMRTGCRSERNEGGVIPGRKIGRLVVNGNCYLLTCGFLELSIRLIQTNYMSERNHEREGIINKLKEHEINVRRGK